MADAVPETPERNSGVARVVALAVKRTGPYRDPTLDKPSGPESELRISLLGGFTVSARQGEVAEERWRLRKSRSLVKLLALSPGHSMHREQVIEALWPEREPAAAANNLRQAMFVVRRALDSCGDDGAARLALA